MNKSSRRVADAWPPRQALVRVIIFMFCFLTLPGCDGSLSVSGTLREHGCELSLWARRGSILADAKSKKVRTALVEPKFAVHWTVSGPQTSHWLEIACPGRLTFKSAEFDAPSVQQEIALGEISLSSK